MTSIMAFIIIRTKYIIIRIIKPADSELKIISLRLTLIFLILILGLSALFGLAFLLLVPFLGLVFLLLVSSAIVVILCCFSVSTSSRNLATIRSKADSSQISFFFSIIPPKLTRPIIKAKPSTCLKR